MPQPGQGVVMAFASMGSVQDAFRSRADFEDPSPGVVNRAFQALAEVEVTAQEMIEYQPEVAFGVGRELRTEGHARGACRQSRRPAACPSAPH